MPGEIINRLLPKNKILGNKALVTICKYHLSQIF